jgi:hypothetical protein
LNFWTTSYVWYFGPKMAGTFHALIYFDLVPIGC